MIHAGTLRHWLVFEDRSSATDAYGQLLDTWTEVCRCRADLQPMRGEEFYAAEQQTARITHRAVIRYNANVRQRHRVNLLGTARYFDVKVIRNFREANRKLILSLDEIVTG